MVGENASFAGTSRYFKILHRRTFKHQMLILRVAEQEAEKRRKVIEYYSCRWWDTRSDSIFQTCKLKGSNMAAKRVRIPRGEEKKS